MTKLLKKKALVGLETLELRFVNARGESVVADIDMATPGLIVRALTVDGADRRVSGLTYRWDGDLAGLPVPGSKFHPSVTIEGGADPDTGQDCILWGPSRLEAVTLIAKPA